MSNIGNPELAQTAIDALTALGYPTVKGRCQHWARVVTAKWNGSNKLFVKEDGRNPPDAIDAAKFLVRKGFAFPKSELSSRGGLQVGDLLYKTTSSGKWGHVGIVIPWKGGLAVAENSTYHANARAAEVKRKTGKTVDIRTMDARGVRTLAQYGDYEFVARFPRKGVVVPASSTSKQNEETLCIWNNNQFHALFDDDKRPYILLAEVVEMVAHYVEKTTNKLDQNPPRFYVRSQPKSKK